MSTHFVCYMYHMLYSYKKVSKRKDVSLNGHKSPKDFPKFLLKKNLQYVDPQLYTRIRLAWVQILLSHLFGLLLVCN